jgi:hypothetical protein
MKKNLWVLLALSALIAMFVIAGCAPKPSSPTPTPTPTTSPTTPPADTACPKVVSTEVVKTFYNGSCEACGWDPCDTVCNGVYSTNCCDCSGEEGVPLGTGAFKIIITFDENIDPIKSSCVLNPANWVIKVKNPDRFDTELTKAAGEVQIIDIAINGKQIIVTAGVMEKGTHQVWVLPGTPITIPYAFCGLVCNLNDANSYADVLNGVGMVPPLPPILSGAVAAPTVADEISWEIGSGCVVSDELGNFCCGFSGSDCCVEPICESCAPCPLEGSICQ